MNPQEKHLLILLLNEKSWLKDMNAQKSKQQKTESNQLTMKQASLKFQNRTLRCGFPEWLVDRFSRPRRTSTSTIPSI